MRDERSLRAVPRWVWALLGLALAAQIAWRDPPQAQESRIDALAPAPSVDALRLAAFGENALLSRLVMLYLQPVALPGVDMERVLGWLRTALELDPRGAYPLFLAARVYGEVPDPTRARMALEFVHQQYLADPDRRWPWLAHAALLAKHRLGDLALARRYAQALERHTRARDVPLWARQMEIFILEDMNELEAARIMLGGLLESGAVDDPAEARFLAERLKALEARLGKR
jgi:hypothetical protein